MESPESLGESTSNRSIPKDYNSNSSSDESSSSSTTRSNPSEIQRRKRLLIRRYLRELSSIVNNQAVLGSNKEMSLDDAAANCNSTIIENAIKYVKQLQERVNSLEEQASCSKKIKCYSTTRQYCAAAAAADNKHGDEYLSCHNDDHDHEKSAEERVIPEVEAKTRGKDVLISIICEKQKGYLTKTISEIEKLRLAVANISALPFGDCFFAISVSAQMGNEISLTAKEIKGNLRQALLEFM